MRRIARYTLNALTVLSLLLCVGTVGLWVRGQSRIEQWAHESGETFVAILVSRGTVCVCAEPLHTPGPPPWYAWNHFSERPSTDLPAVIGVWRSRPLWGFGWTDGRPVGRESAVVAPLWAAVLAFGFTPVWRLVRAGLWRRHVGLGLCSRCGYDLRATPDRCPECGTAKGAA